MPRLSEEKHDELEEFRRAHIQGWRDSTLNPREYCEAHRLPLNGFGNWRSKFGHEDPRVTGKLLWRRGGGAEHMLRHMRSDAEPPHILSGRSGDDCRRRNFGKADKRRIVEEAGRPGATVSGVAKKYGIGPGFLFQWKKDLMPDPQPEPAFAEVKLSDAPPTMVMPSPAPPFVVERPAPGIEVDLKGGRRVRFDRETDPETIRTLVALLEGAGQ